MEIEVVNKRKSELIEGLKSLNSRLEEIKVAIEIQKGAISECNYWVSELSKEKEEPSEKKEKSLKKVN